MASLIPRDIVNYFSRRVSNKNLAKWLDNHDVTPDKLALENPDWVIIILKEVYPRYYKDSIPRIQYLEHSIQVFKSLKRNYDAFCGQCELQKYLSSVLTSAVFSSIKRKEYRHKPKIRAKKESDNY